MRGWRAAAAAVAGMGDGSGGLWMFSRTDLLVDGGGGRVIGMDDGSGAAADVDVVGSWRGVVAALNAIFFFFPVQCMQTRKVKDERMMVGVGCGGGDGGFWKYINPPPAIQPWWGYSDHHLHTGIVGDPRGACGTWQWV